VITSGDAVGLAEQACRGGARILQYRESRRLVGRARGSDSTASSRRMLETARRIGRIAAAHGTLFIVNDRIDIALLAGADGVHLGQDDIPISDARELAPDDFLIGISTHSIDQARQAESSGADYVGIGPVFGTPTKPGSSPTGVGIVRAVVEAVHLPVVAIGGIDLGSIPELREAGVTNVAMIRGFAVDTGDRVRSVNRMLLGGRRPSPASRRAG